MSPFLFAFTGPVVLFFGTLAPGPGLFFGPVLFFGIIPALDSLVSLDKDNEPKAPWLRWVPVAYVPVQVVALLFTLWVAVTGELPAWQRMMLVFNAGLASSMGINVAHELMHRPGRLEQRLAEVLMAASSYTHFCVEHVQGHHKRIGTPADPATSRLGESLWAFLPRSIVGSAVSAWHIEHGKHGWSVHNRILQYAAAHVLILSGVTAWLGPLGLAAFLGQSCVSFGMLETINYIEHYGLIRPEIAPGRYGRVLPEHSWNSSHKITNWMLLNLARHSDHHAFAARAFPELRHHESAPQLPASYTAMMLLAAFPPLWFAVMDPRVRALREAGATA